MLSNWAFDTEIIQIFYYGRRLQQTGVIYVEYEIICNFAAFVS